MRTLTLQEARKRTGLDLLNDRQIFFTDYVAGRFGTVADGQKRMACRYPFHEEMVQEGKRFFAAKGYEIYPHGLTVNGSGTCPDFAAFRNDRVIFVECLTSGWASVDVFKKKARLARYGKVAFIIEHPEFAELPGAKRRRLTGRLAALSRIYPVFLYHPDRRALSRVK